MKELNINNANNSYNRTIDKSQLKDIINHIIEYTSCKQHTYFIAI